MRAIQYLPLAITEATRSTDHPNGLPVQPVRFARGSEIDPTVLASGPAVLFRVESNQYVETMDADRLNMGGTVFFEIECRAPTCPGAIQIAEDITEQLQKDDALSVLLSSYDEPDDASQERGNYFSHIVAVGLPGGGLQTPRSAAMLVPVEWPGSIPVEWPGAVAVEWSSV